MEIQNRLLREAVEKDQLGSNGDPIQNALRGKRDECADLLEKYGRRVHPAYKRDYPLKIVGASLAAPFLRAKPVDLVDYYIVDKRIRVSIGKDVSVGLQSDNALLDRSNISLYIRPLRRWLTMKKKGESWIEDPNFDLMCLRFNKPRQRDFDEWMEILESLKIKLTRQI